MRSTWVSTEQMVHAVIYSFSYLFSKSCVLSVTLLIFLNCSYSEMELVEMILPR